MTSLHPSRRAPADALTGGGDTLAALRLGDLARARELTLCADLTELPPEVVALADTLEVLDLSGNRLTGLPPGFAQLKRLKALFVSGNCFDVLPPVLGELPELSQVGARGCGVAHLPAEALPLKLRWLTLTDNRIGTLPDELGRRPQLQKLLLAGNRLRALPETLAGAERLELLRLAANRLEDLPAWLAELPALAWLAWASNPFEPSRAAPAVRTIEASELSFGDMLGEGASGQVRRALWNGPDSREAPVAVKLFKGAMTSDGLPEHEMAACLTAGDHPGLAGALGRLAGGAQQGLVMPLLPAHWRVLAGPPSRESCSRDVYAPGERFALGTALRIAAAVAGAAAHLRARGLMHGDLYAHNILWDGSKGEAVLTDFGAASFLPAGGHGWERLEVLAFGRLLAELLARSDGVTRELEALSQACLSSEPRARPTIADASAQLQAMQERI